MLRTLRAFMRLLAFVALLVLHYIEFEVGRMFLRAPEHARAWRTVRLRAWARATARAIGIDLEKIGAPPAAPYFLVFNHLSYVDVLLLLAFIEHPMVCARHDFAGWPVLGFIAQRIGAIWVHRANFNAMPQVTGEMGAAMHAGFGVVMAPEATTTRGDKVYPFHSTLLDPAARLGVPVHYCSLRYATTARDAPASKIVNWWEPMSFFAHGWRMVHANRITATIRFAETAVIASDRKLLARALHDAVSAIYEPM